METATVIEHLLHSNLAPLSFGAHSNVGNIANSGIISFLNSLVQFRIIFTLFLFYVFIFVERNTT